MEELEGQSHALLSVMLRAVDQMNGDCVFCKIAAGIIKTERIYEDSKAMAIKDLSPLAPVHILVMPKQHIGKLHTLGDTELDIAEHCFRVVSRVAEKIGIQDSGYRVAVNQGKDAGQEIEHLHLHLIGGQNLKGIG